MYRKIIIFFQQYQEHIKNFIESLEEALGENKLSQSRLRREIDDLGAGKPVKQMKTLYQNSVIARNSVTVFHAPYFKDVNLYTHPPNEDVLKKRANGELDLYLTNPRELTELEKTSLRDEVRKDAINKRLVQLVEEERLVLTMYRKAGISEEKKQELMKQIRALHTQETEIKLLPEEILFQNIDEEYDWMKIAAKVFKRSIPHESLRLMWKNNLHPQIYRGRWTRNEDRRLMDLITNPDEDGLCRSRKDWDRIAYKLGTKRNAFLCFHRYQTKHNSALNGQKWTRPEDDRLRQLVRQTRINKFIPWNKVAYYMTNRTKDQCYQRYMCSLREKLQKGFFNEIEDFIVIVGVRLFGTKWDRIADFIPSRTPMQIHSRYNTYLKANFENWTEDEDKVRL